VAQQASAVVICTTPSALLRPGTFSLRVRLNSRLRAVARGALLAFTFAASPLHAQSNNVRITKLSDVAFGAIANVGADAQSGAARMFDLQMTEIEFGFTAREEPNARAFPREADGQTLADPAARAGDQYRDCFERVHHNTR